MNKFTTHTALLSVIITGLLVFTGCSENNLGAVKVTGTVTLDGEPISGVTVAFLPAGATGREAYGTTDAQGQFVLTIPSAAAGSGAIPGTYNATFSKEHNPRGDEMWAYADELRDQGMNEDQIPGEVARRFPGGLPDPIDLIPEKYKYSTSAAFPPVTVEKGKKNDFMFDLSAK